MESTKSGQLITSDALAAAERRLRGRVLRTPLVPSLRLSAELGVNVFLKPENLQHTGSFKVRGAINALLARADAGALPAGVTTFSAGNHAAATSFAAQSLGIPVIVCMPPGAVATKIDAVLVLYTDGIVEAKSPSGDVYGNERLEQLIAQHGALPAPQICERVIEDVSGWMASQDDDMTLVVARHIGA